MRASAARGSSGSGGAAGTAEAVAPAAAALAVAAAANPRPPVFRRGPVQGCWRGPQSRPPSPRPPQPGSPAGAQPAFGCASRPPRSHGRPRAAAAPCEGLGCAGASRRSRRARPQSPGSSSAPENPSHSGGGGSSIPSGARPRGPELVAAAAGGGRRAAADAGRGWRGCGRCGAGRCGGGGGWRSTSLTSDSPSPSRPATRRTSSSRRTLGARPAIACAAAARISSVDASGRSSARSTSKRSIGTASSSSARIVSAPERCTTSAGSWPAGRRTIRNSTPRVERFLLCAAQRRDALGDRLLARAVRVLAEQRLRRQPGDRLDLRVRQRRPHLGDRLGHARLMERDHVRVALDEHHAAGLRRGRARHVRPVDDPALVEELALGGVQVLGLVLGAHRPRAEPEHAAALVGQRERDAPAEAIDQPTLPALRQPGREQLLVGVAVALASR